MKSIGIAPTPSNYHYLAGIVKGLSDGDWLLYDASSMTSRRKIRINHSNVVVWPKDETKFDPPFKAWDGKEWIEQSKPGTWPIGLGGIPVQPKPPTTVALTVVAMSLFAIAGILAVWWFLL